MNKLFAIFIAVFLSCGSSGKISQNIEASEALVFPSSNIQQDMLLGEFQRQELEEEPFSRWFEPVYAEYNPNDEAIQIIEENISDYEITLVMGTWCGDSKRETPKFFKILDEVNYDPEKLTAIAVDYNKDTPTGIAEGLDVQRVPTIIFYKNGKEVNRFVEYAQKSLEEDIAKIVSEEEYSHSYAQ